MYFNNDNILEILEEIEECFTIADIADRFNIPDEEYYEVLAQLEQCFQELVEFELIVLLDVKKENKDCYIHTDVLARQRREQKIDVLIENRSNCEKRR